MHDYIFCEDSKKAFVGDRVKVLGYPRGVIGNDGNMVAVEGTISSIGWAEGKYFSFILEEELGRFYCYDSKVCLLESHHENTVLEKESNFREETIKKIADKYYLDERLLKCSSTIAELLTAINDMLRIGQFTQCNSITQVERLDALDEGIAKASVILEQLKYYRYYQDDETNRIEQLIDMELEKQLKQSAGNYAEKYLA